MTVASLPGAQGRSPAQELPPSALQIPRLAQEVGQTPVVRDPEAQRRAVEEVKRAAASLGLEVLGECESPLRGPKGNREWFLWLRRDA